MLSVLSFKLDDDQVVCELSCVRVDGSMVGVQH